MTDEQKEREIIVCRCEEITLGEIRDWRAAAWRLERRWPEEYKEKKGVELKEQPILIDDIMGDIDEEDI